MKRSKSKALALSACLLASLAFSTGIHAEAQENTNFKAGLAAYQANDLPLAYKEFLTAAKAGHSDSQFNIALMHEHAMGIKKDEKLALSWYEKSAQQGNSNAQYNLGVLFENGRGTKVNFAKANEWYRKASVQGDSWAIGNLGMLYIRADGVKENKTAGVALLLQSVTLDNSPENQAKKNITSTRGLTPEMVQKAQALSDIFSEAENLLVPLDAYLKQSKE